MTDHQIRCFLVSAETLSFTAAAEQLHFLPQTVSKNVRSLEEELGVVLFNRGHNSLELTNGGVYYANRFRKLQHAYFETIDDLRKQYQSQRRTLTIAISERLQFGGELLNAIRAYQAENPDIKISGMIGDTTRSILRKEADVGVLYTQNPLDETSFHTSFITEDQQVLYISNWVRGVAVGQYYDPKCWGACFIDDHPDTSSNLEALESLRRSLSLLNLAPQHIDFMPNPRSVLETFRVSSVVTVAGRRFSLLAQAKGLRIFELPTPPSKLYLACIWNKTNDNPMIPAFVQHMKECLDG